MKTISPPKFTAAFVNTEEAPVSKKFIGLEVIEQPNGDLTAMVLEEVRYRHPDAPENAVLPVLEYRSCKTVRPTTHEAAAYKMLLAAQQTLKFQLSREFVFHS